MGTPLSKQNTNEEVKSKGWSFQKSSEMNCELKSRISEFEDIIDNNSRLMLSLSQKQDSLPDSILRFNNFNQSSIPFGGIGNFNDLLIHNTFKSIPKAHIIPCNPDTNIVNINKSYESKDLEHNTILHNNNIINNSELMNINSLNNNDISSNNSNTFMSPLLSTKKKVLPFNPNALSPLVNRNTNSPVDRCEERLKNLKLVLLYDYNVTAPNQFLLKKGQILEYVSQSKQKDWYMIKAPNSLDCHKSAQMTGWVPANFLSPACNDLKDTRDELFPWYHGSLSRKRAEELLASTPGSGNGHFIVRESESLPGQYSVSLRFNDKVYHYRINNTGSSSAPSSTSITSSCVPASQRQTGGTSNSTSFDSKSAPKKSADMFLHALKLDRVNHHKDDKNYKNCKVGANNSGKTERKTSDDSYERDEEEVKKIGQSISDLTQNKYFIVAENCFGTLGELIHHHSFRANGLVCPLLHPLTKNYPVLPPSSVANNYPIPGSTSANLGVSSHFVPNALRLTNGGEVSLLQNGCGGGNDKSLSHRKEAAGKDNLIPRNDPVSSDPNKKSIHPPEYCNDELSRRLNALEMDRDLITLKHKIGSGQYGDVYQANLFSNSANNQSSLVKVAVKTLKEETMAFNDFLQEACIMKEMKHPNLVQLLGVCIKCAPYYIITEYMGGGNLLEYVQKLNSASSLMNAETERDLIDMSAQIASGMAYLETRNYIHRDLAARNVLVSRSSSPNNPVLLQTHSPTQNAISNNDRETTSSKFTCKVADFGLARKLSPQTAFYCAKPGAKFPIKWTAPEGLARNKFSAKSDVWAFGILLWEIFSMGSQPYPSVELSQVLQFLEKDYRMSRPSTCPENVYSLMLKCWIWEPNERPTFQNLHAQLQAFYRNPLLAQSNTNNEESFLDLYKSSSMNRRRNSSDRTPKNVDSSPALSLDSNYEPRHKFSGHHFRNRKYSLGVKAPNFKNFTNNSNIANNQNINPVNQNNLNNHHSRFEPDKFKNFPGGTAAINDFSANLNSFNVINDNNFAPRGGKSVENISKKREDSVKNGGNHILNFNDNFFCRPPKPQSSYNHHLKKIRDYEEEDTQVTSRDNNFDLNKFSNGNNRFDSFDDNAGDLKSVRTCFGTCSLDPLQIFDQILSQNDDTNE